MSDPSRTGAQEFWEAIFARGAETGYSRVAMPDPADPIVPAALNHFGDLSGRTVLDLGCGRGAMSLLFASKGAQVTSVDLSQTAIQNLTQYCQEHGIRNVRPVQASAMEIDRLGPVDFVFGSMILHHIEPLSEFVPVLRRTVSPGGRGFFFENNARNRLMIWFRQNMVGRYGIPKFGDPDEFPLTPDEVELLRRDFDVRVEHPEIWMFRLFSDYFFRGNFREPLTRVDRWLYRGVPPLRQHSYIQYLYLS